MALAAGLRYKHQTMSFWDKLKPVARTPAASAVRLEAERAEVALDWDDGAHTAVSMRLLRQSCPCAECVEEWSGRRTLDPESVPADSKVLEATPVGNYAVAFVFSDGHRTGIFNWSSLRALSAKPPA
ncbi:MAG: DUF971 domain-containing protein [Myxococcaceae bacterium]